MLTWKRNFMAAAVGSNLVVFAAPSGACFYLAIDQLAFTGRPLSVGNPFEVASLGFTLFACGLFNLACLYSACKSCGSHWVWWMGLGVALCAFTAIWTMGLLMSTSGPFRGSEYLVPSFMLGALTFTTAGALWHLRPRLKPDWQCQHCAYDLRGLEEMGRGLDGTVCPECGNDASEGTATQDGIVAIRFVFTPGDPGPMTSKIALIFVSLASSLFLFTLPGLGLLMIGLIGSDVRMIFYGFAFAIIGVVNLVCTRSLLRSEFNVSDRTLKTGFAASIAVACFGLIASIERESPVPIAFFILLALLNAAPFSIAKRCRLPEGACETCGYDLAGLPSSVCPKCGNEKSPD